MKKWNLLVNVAHCHNCGNCVLANKDEHVGNNYPGYSAPQPSKGDAWIRIANIVRGTSPMVDTAYLPVFCNHCDDAPCVMAGGGAIKKRQDGIVIIDPIAAKGHQDLLASCPYGAMYWNEELAIPQIWTFDAHLLDAGWKEPRCCQVCPTGALQAVLESDSDMQDRVVREALEVLQPEHGTAPRVYYRNLYRYTRCFIGGSVAHTLTNTPECLAGATVKLSHKGKVFQQVVTDAFGDFKFDNLPPASGRYRIDVEHTEYSTTVLEIELQDNSVYLGVVWVNKVPDTLDSTDGSSMQEGRHA